MGRIVDRSQLGTGTACFAFALALGASSAFAQGGPSAPPEAHPAEDGEAIIVTGSRIARPDLASSSPVVVVSSEALRQNNVVTVEQILTANPQFVGNATAAANNPGDGTANIDLRGLGASRTLVLIDGKRAPYYNANGQVDVNGIPIALIKRVEVLTGGASAVYGSDAISGVVNFILDDRFTGLRADASSAVSKYKDAATYDISLTSGLALGDRGNIILSGSYSQRRPLRFAARNRNATTLDPADLSPTGSPNTAPTLFDIGYGGPKQVTATGALSPDIRPYDYTPINYVQAPLKRYTATALARYDLTDGIELYGRGIYTRSKVQLVLAPTATAGFTFNISPDNPFLTPAEQAAFFAPGATINDGSDIANDPTARSGTAVVSISRRMIETPGRVQNYDTKSLQVLGGLRGELGSRYHWDVSVQYSRVNRKFSLENDLSYSALQQALDVVPGPSGAPACFNPSDGCVPLNLFTDRTITPQELTFVLRDGAQQDRTSQLIAQGSLGGNLGFLESPWASGPAAFSIGGEYRRETGRTSVDPNYASGDLIYYGQGQNISGKYDVKEAFAELKMPIVGDRPFLQSLGIEAGFRYSDYSTAGSVTSYKLGGDWSPIQGVRFRGIYQRAVRAPNIFELFSPVVGGTGSLANDPCAGPGVPADIASICVAQGAPVGAIGSIPQPAAEQINNFQGGNPNLDVEKSDTYTVGVVINPASLRNLSIAADYYSIRIANAIDTVPAALTVSQCYNVDLNASSPACSSIRRNTLTGGLRGNIQFGVPEVYGNLASLKSRGLDVSVNYRGGAREGFHYSVSVAGTYTLAYRKQVAPTAPVVECAGRFGLGCDLEPISKWKHVAEVNLAWKQWSLVTRWRYLGSVKQDVATNILVSRIPAFSYFDTTLGIAVKENFSLRLGMQNIFDKKPPIIGDGVNRYVAGNTFPNTYDVIGRTFFAGVSATF